MHKDTLQQYQTNARACPITPNRCIKPRSEPCGDKHADQRGVNNRGAKADGFTFTPLELIDRIAALVPPPRTHRYRYFGVLAPNLPLRSVVTAMAQAQVVESGLSPLRRLSQPPRMIARLVQAR